tara:strand:- start:538 stop:687 length:150 start_codon:yes stop_codon:yes gene_type:complete
MIDLSKPVFVGTKKLTGTPADLNDRNVSTTDMFASESIYVHPIETTIGR